MTDTPAHSHELVVRRNTAQAVLDRALRKRFKWGKVDCGRSIVAPVLRGLGHPCPLAPFGQYSSELGALRALKRNGFDSMEHYLDKRGFFRIGHASALTADLVGMKSFCGDWLVMGVVVGNGRVFSFLGEEPDVFGVVVEPKQIDAAWRIPCLVKAAA